MSLGQVLPRTINNAINKIRAVILKHKNPFASNGDRLQNVITHAYIPDKNVPSILTADVTGQKQYEEHVTEHEVYVAG